MVLFKLKYSYLLIKEQQNFAAIEFAKKMNLTDPEVIHSEVMHPSEGTRVQLKGKVDFFINTDDLIIPQKPEVLSDDEIRAFVDEHPFKIVAATVGEDEHSVGLKEVIDIKHGGIEKFGMEVEYLEHLFLVKTCRCCNRIKC